MCDTGCNRVNSVAAYVRAVYAGNTHQKTLRNPFSCSLAVKNNDVYTTFANESYHCHVAFRPHPLKFRQ